MIMRTISQTFCHVVCSCPISGYQLDNVCKFLEETTDWPFLQLLRSGDHVNSLLLLHLGDHHEQVTIGECDRV